MKNPDGAGPGCMLYPLKPCDTEPLIDVKDITLRNVRSYGNLLPPGIVRCHESNKCTDIVFENVHASGWWRLFGLNYITENVEGTVTKSRPTPAFTNADDNSVFYEGDSFNNEFEIEDGFGLMSKVELLSKIQEWIRREVKMSEVESNHGEMKTAFEAIVEKFGNAYKFITN